MKHGNLIPGVKISGPSLDFFALVLSINKKNNTLNVQISSSEGKGGNWFEDWNLEHTVSAINEGFYILYLPAVNSTWDNSKGELCKVTNILNKDATLANSSNFPVSIAYEDSSRKQWVLLLNDFVSAFNSISPAEYMLRQFIIISQTTGVSVKAHLEFFKIKLTVTYDEAVKVSMMYNISLNHLITLFNIQETENGSPTKNN